MAGIRRDKLDSVFSDLVRGRAGWKSDYLGGEGHLECAHIYGRARRSVRWHPMNAVCLTHYEHRYFTANPIIFATWCNAKFGPDYMHKLAMMAAQPRKFTPREIEGLYQHYKNELAVMTALRETGHEGRIEFVFPDPIIEAAPRKKAKKAKAKKPGRSLKNPKFKRTLAGKVVERAA